MHARQRAAVAAYGLQIRESRASALYGGVAGTLVEQGQCGMLAGAGSVI